MELKVRIPASFLPEIELILSGIEYECFNAKNSDGDLSSVVLIVSLATLTIRQATNIILESIKAKGKKSIKLGKLEMSGYSEEEIIQVIKESKK